MNDHSRNTLPRKGWLKNIIVSFDNECGVSAKDLVRILRRKKYFESRVNFEVTSNGLAVLRVLESEEVGGNHEAQP